MEKTYSVYSPLNKQFFNFGAEQEATKFYKDFIGDAVLLFNGKIMEEKLYGSTSFEKMVHSGLFLSDIHNEKMRSFPSSDTIKHYNELLPLFKNPVKGVILIGPFGVGKTSAMKIFSWAISAGWISIDLKWQQEGRPSPSFEILDAFQLKQNFAVRGFPGLYETEVLSISNKNICLDNIRTDNGIASHMGNKTNVLLEAIESRYHGFTQQGLKTHFVTTLKPPQLRTLFGDETYDRICQMGNLYVMTGNSNR